MPLNRLSFSGFPFQDRTSFFYSQLNDRVVCFMIDSIAWYLKCDLNRLDNNISYRFQKASRAGQHTIFCEEISGRGYCFFCKFYSGTGYLVGNLTPGQGAFSDFSAHLPVYTK